VWLFFFVNPSSYIKNITKKFRDGEARVIEKKGLHNWECEL